MDSILKSQIKSYLLEYLQKRMSNYETKGKMLRCPFEHNHQEKSDTLTANIFPVNSNKLHCYDPNCGDIGDVFSLCRHYDFNDNADVDDEDIAQFLIKEFDIQTNNEIANLFTQFFEWGWDLVPVQKNDKASNIEKEWQKKSHKDIREWESWYKNGLNLGVKCGEVSNILCADFDFIDGKLKKKIYEANPTEHQLTEARKQYDANLSLVKEKMPFLDWETVRQETFGGIHLLFYNDKDIVNTCFDWEGIHIDILSDNKQFVVQPSIVGDFQRKIIGKTIKPIPQEFKYFILQNSNKKQEAKEVVVSDQTTDISDKITGLDGKCNSTFIKVLGQLRKFIPLDNVERTAHIINQQMLDIPMDNKTIRSMCQQIDKYHEVDIDAIGQKIIDHLRVVETAHTKDLKECLGYDRNDLEHSLKVLCDLKKVIKVKKDLYRLIKTPEWKEEFLSLGKPLGYKIPYFEQYAYVDNSNMIIIGASSGVGKTTLSINFVDAFVKQGIKPYLISTEAGSKFQKVAQCLGLKEGDFKYIITNDPTSIDLPENAVVIIDWLKEKDSDYSKVDLMYEKLNNKLVEKGGLLIIFTQLKRESLAFYAEDMTLFFGTIVAKLSYNKINGVYDNTNPVLNTIKIRDSKVNQQYLTIPLKYDDSTRRLELK